MIDFLKYYPCPYQEHSADECKLNTHPTDIQVGLDASYHTTFGLTLYEVFPTFDVAREPTKRLLWSNSLKHYRNRHVHPAPAHMINDQHRSDMAELLDILNTMLYNLRFFPESKFHFEIGYQEPNSQNSTLQGTKQGQGQILDQEQYLAMGMSLDMGIDIDRDMDVDIGVCVDTGMDMCMYIE